MLPPPLAPCRTGLNAMEIPELLLLVMETSLVSLCMKIMSVLITVILYGRMIEIYLYCSVSPIPFATMTNREWGQIGNNYLKALFALGFQGFLIMICVGIYAVLGKQHDNSGQPAQRDFFPCSLHRYPLFLPVQIRRTGKIHIQRTLSGHIRRKEVFTWRMYPYRKTYPKSKQKSLSI